MKNDVYIIRVTLESMLRLMEARDRAEKQDRLPGAQHPEEPATPVVSTPEEETYNRKGAAHFLNKSERQVCRYRISGKLAHHIDDDNLVYYLHSDLERLFEKLWGFPKR